MSRRIDIELTSALPDDSWTWRAAGAKQPKGTLDGSILDPGAAVGDVIKVEIDQEIDGITVRSVVGGRQKQDRTDMLELLPTEREFQPVIETRAKRDRRDRQRDDRGGRRGRGDRDRDRDRGRGRRDRGDGDDRRGDRSRGDRSGKGKRGGPSFTPPPEVPQRPKPKRLKPGKQHRNAVLADIPEEQRGIAEVALQGMGAVRQRLREENERAAAEDRSPMPEATVIKMAEDLLPRLRVAEWRDRAEAAQRQMDNLDLRDLRSVVAAAGDPAVARDESTSALAVELTEALATKQEQETLLWFGDVDAALAVGRVIRALRLSSQPPKAGVPFPSDIAQRLIDSTNASLAPMDSAERWVAVLEAAAFSPIRTAVAPIRKPDAVTDELTATVTRLAPALPQVAVLFEIEVDPKAPMPKPLRPGPRKGGKGGKGVGKGAKSGGKSDGKGGQDSDRPSRGRGRQRAAGSRDRSTGRTEDSAAPGRDAEEAVAPSAESGSSASASPPSDATDASNESPDSTTTDDTAGSDDSTDAITDTATSNDSTDATTDTATSNDSTDATTDTATSNDSTDATTDTATSNDSTDATPSDATPSDDNTDATTDTATSDDSTDATTDTATSDDSHEGGEADAGNVPETTSDDPGQADADVAASDTPAGDGGQSTAPSDGSGEAG